MSTDEDILFAVENALGVVTLNRPKALNALTLDMCRRMESQLAAWQADPTVAAVLVKGSGDRAFCAGGDVVAIYNSARGDRTVAAEFFRAEYTLNRRIFHFPKPFIALLDGVTMGGGVGVSVHGSHRVATERTLFAMPETGIGLFPDVGGSYFLPRLPGALGLYLGLTGARIKAADCCYADIASDYVSSDKLDALEAALGDANFHREAHEVVDSIFADWREDPGAPPLAEHRMVVDKCFLAGSVEEIIERLHEERNDWASETAALLESRSPTSLKITFRQLHEGATLDFDTAMTMEYRLSQACVAGHDFVEGVRAAVIDKDRTPNWNPASLAEITDDLVNRHFGPQEPEDLVFS